MRSALGLPQLSSLAAGERSPRRWGPAPMPATKAKTTDKIRSRRLPNPGRPASPIHRERLIRRATPSLTRARHSPLCPVGSLARAASVERTKHRAGQPGIASRISVGQSMTVACRTVCAPLPATRADCARAYRAASRPRAIRAPLSGPKRWHASEGSAGGAVEGPAMIAGGPSFPSFSCRRDRFRTYDPYRVK